MLSAGGVSSDMNSQPTVAPETSALAFRAATGASARLFDLVEPEQKAQRYSVRVQVKSGDFLLADSTVAANE